MKISICSIEGLADAASYDAASLKIDAMRREKLARIKGETERKRSLCAGLLVNYAVWQFQKEQECDFGQVEEVSPAELLCIPRQEYDYRQDSNGKPYLADLPGFFFNVSHSGDYVLLARDTKELGADIQKMDRTVTDALAGKVLSKAEYAHYCTLPNEEQRKAFYRAWTIKESCCKLTGKGLSQDFREMKLSETGQEIVLIGEARRIHFQALPWKEEYWLAVSRFV